MEQRVSNSIIVLMSDTVSNSIAVLMLDTQFMPAPVLNRLSAVSVLVTRYTIHILCQHRSWIGCLPFFRSHGTQHTSYASIGPESGVYPFFGHMVHNARWWILKTIVSKEIHAKLKVLQSPCETGKNTASSDTRMLKIQRRFNRKTHFFRTFSHFGPHIWNNLPQDIRHSATLPSFKSQLKTFLFSEYCS